MLNFAHGAVQWLAADPATTKYSVTGLGFTPKAIRFYWTGIQSATDAASTALHMRRGIGFAISPSARRSAQATSLDNAATSDCTSSAYDNRIAGVLNAAQNATGALDLDAITSDGFDLIVDAATEIDVTVFWEAWGGDDITVAVVGDAPEPAATGNQDYTVTGFIAGATDQVVMFAGVYSTAALNSTVGSDSSFCIGFATSGAAADNISCGGSADDGSAVMDTEGWGLDGECLSKTVAGGGSVNARAQLTQFNTDGFRLNWISRAVSNRRNIWMAIKGGNWKAGSYVIDSDTAGNTQTVSGLPFQPIGGCLMGRGFTETAAGAVGDDDIVALSSFSSPASRRSMAWWDDNGADPSNISLRIEHDQILAFAGASGPTFDLDSINSDGFTTIVDSGAGGSNTEWHGYLTFGNAPGALAGSAGLALAGIGALAGSGALAGNSVLVAAVAGTLAGNGALAGNAACVWIGAAALTGAGALAASSALAFELAGTLTGQGAGQIAGTAAVAWNLVGTLAGSAPLAGTIAVELGGNAVLTAAGALAGGANVAFDAAGAFAGAGQLAGGSGLALAVQGALAGDGVLAGGATLAWSQAAVLQGLGFLDGAAPLTFAAVGAVTGRGALAGVVPLVFTATLEVGPATAHDKRTLEIDLAGREIDVVLDGRTISVANTSRTLN